MPHALPARLPRVPGLPAFEDGQVEALKWIALAAMVLDHVGRLWFDHGTRGWVFAGGRLAFPLFAMVLGLNLARAGDQAARCARAVRRLALWCAIAVVPSVLARGHPGLVNVLGTLALGAALCWAFAARAGTGVSLLVCALAVAASARVEFGLPGVLLVPMTWLAWRGEARQAPALVALLVALVGVGNARAGGAGALAATLATLPLAWTASRLPLAPPRLGQALYGFYPLHLALIGLLRPLA